MGGVLLEMRTVTRGIGVAKGTSDDAGKERGEKGGQVCQVLTEKTKQCSLSLVVVN